MFLEQNHFFKHSFIQKYKQNMPSKGEWIFSWAWGPQAPLIPLPLPLTTFSSIWLCGPKDILRDHRGQVLWEFQELGLLDSSFLMSFQSWLLIRTATGHAYSFTLITKKKTKTGRADKRSKALGKKRQPKGILSTAISFPHRDSISTKRPSPCWAGNTCKYHYCLYLFPLTAVTHYHKFDG